MLNLKIDDFKWKKVLEIKKQKHLQKGSNDFNKSLLAKADKIKNKFGCYCWSNSKVICYVGSFTKPYSHIKSSNLKGRLHQYLYNHPSNKNGTPMTNKKVFNKINETLRTSDVQLKILSFSNLVINSKNVCYEDFSSSPDLILAVEKLLIAKYRIKNQNLWNS